MPRLEPVEPWYHAAKGWFVVQWRGKRHYLAKGKSKDDRAAKAAARKALRRLLDGAEAGADDRDQAATMTTGEVIYKFLADLRKRRDRGEITAGHYSSLRYRLETFAELFGSVPVGQLRKHHVTEWLNTRNDWGPTTRHHCAGDLKAVTAWVDREGLIPDFIDPLAKVKKPARGEVRNQMPSADALAAVFSQKMKRQLRDLLEFLHLTGCRPIEARTMTAAMIDFERGVAVLHAHKTMKKTHKPRVIYLTPEALAIVRRLALKHPEGPIFRNTQNAEWSRASVGAALRRLRQRAKVGPELVPYSMRHLFATDAVAEGTSAAVVAELLGHKDIRMLSRYSHISERHDTLRESAEKVRKEAPKADAG